MQEVQDTTILSCFALPIRLAKIYKFDNTLYSQDLEKESIMGRKVNWRAIWKYLSKLQMHTSQGQF